MFTPLVEFIEDKFVGENEDNELIKLNTRYTSARFYDPEEFKHVCFNYIAYKEQMSKHLTDPQNNYQVIGAYNVIYLDGDWTFPREFKESDYEEYSVKLMNIYLTAWLDELSANNYEYYYFEFVPNTYPNGKGGFHCFIYCDDNIMKDQRREMYANIKRKLTVTESDKLLELVDMFKFDDSVEDEERENTLTSNTFYEKLFDPQPLISCQCLLPYAQKDSTSRKYKLFDTTFDPSDLPDYFVIPIQHRETGAIGSNDMISTNEAAVYDDDNEDLDELKNLLHTENMITWKTLGKVGLATAEFMSSLRYLSKNHAFWKQLADHDRKLKIITRNLISFILVNYFIEHRGRRPDNANNEFYIAIAQILHPLLKMTTINNNEKTERDKFSSLLQNIHQYFDKYADISPKVAPQGENRLDSIDHMNLYDSTLTCFWTEYLHMKPNEKGSLGDEDLAKLKRIKTLFQKAYGNWFRFLTETLLAGLTDEIKPFKKVDILGDDPRDHVVFDEVMREQPSVNNNAKIEDTFYIKTIRLWCRMFIVEEIYNTKSMQETIRSILTALCRYFIWYSKKQNGNTRIYIYNIRQTKTLCQYPYNQWILDSDDGDLMKDWIKTIYLTFLKPELLTINLPCGIKPILDNLKIANITDMRNMDNMVKPLNNFDKDMETAYKNIISSFTQEYNNPPKELNPVSSSWFPMRNGLLEFIGDGSVRMHYDNITRFMNVYSNVIYDDKYDYSCEEFKKITTMWEQIFPIEEERDYCLKIFSSALNGKILKDMLLIQYGGGGDGKTVSNNAMLGLLGTEGFSSYCAIQENGKVYYAENPNGMGTTMKTDTILTSSKGTHDEGGSIMLKDRRFCTVQEPDPNQSNGNLNCARIKELLSGTTITSRAIYKKAESFAPNVILTLQTNVLLGYTEDTDAIRRRITVIPYRSKFTTEIAGDKFDTLKYVYTADPQFTRNLTEDPKYWQAIFYSLLPYVQELTRSRVKALSDIPRPKSIIEATNRSFISSNSLGGWLAKNIVQVPGYVLSIARLKEEIIVVNRDELINKKGAILENKKPAEVANEIFNKLNQTYIGRIYQLKDKYYNANKTSILSEDGNEVVSEEIINEDVDRDSCKSPDGLNNQIIKKWLKPNAINNINSVARLRDNTDLFILGYRLLKEVDTADEESMNRAIDAERIKALKQDDDNDDEEEEKPKPKKTRKSDKPAKTKEEDEAGDFM